MIFFRNKMQKVRVIDKEDFVSTYRDIFTNQITRKVSYCCVMVEVIECNSKDRFPIGTRFSKEIKMVYCNHKLGDEFVTKLSPSNGWYLC